MVKITSPLIEPFPVLGGHDNNNNYNLKFGLMMFSVHPWVARFQLKLYLFPDEL
jgi:hypothetical protein